MTLRISHGAPLICAILTLAASSSWAADQPAAAKSPSKSTHQVKKGPFKIEVKLDGVFEAREMTPLSIDAEAWTKLTVLEAVAHGARVEAGQTLVSLDHEEIDTTIADLEAMQKLSELAIRLAGAELKSAEAELPVDLAAAERAKRVAEEDLKRFLEKTRPLSQRSAEFALKSAQQRLEYQLEELKQLEKMYQADDLTEETEEIILKRARNDVEQANFFLETARSRTQETLEVTLPREETQLKDAARRQELALEHIKASMPLSPDRLRLTLEKSVLDHQQAAERLKKLKKDREAMAVKAPTAGIVYYGHCEHGKWSDSSGGKLTRGSSISPHAVFMTIVKERPIFVRASAAEKDLRRLKKGAAGYAVSVAFPDLKLRAKVESVAAVPTADRHFDARFSVEAGEDAKALLPGMTCHVTLVAYRKSDAVTIPASALFTDDADERKHYVYRVGADGTHQRADVATGERTDDKVEVTRGLLEGDTILTEKP
ncbi:MAG TPA: HlyD family efflux transporter periplasmic adaptor subunit [Pirellulales bacterium]|nr:HlyD family efflux transporter periplasmic adaptor subunit [Pirellulales bacterium]